MSRAQYHAALVTGASHRIGRSIAVELAAKGVAVGVHYGTSEDAAHAVVADIKAHGGKAGAVQADLASEVDVQKLVSDTACALDTPIDVLINNASIYEEDTLQTFTSTSWDRHQKINLLAPLMLMQSMATNLPTKNAGAIINIIDQRVLKLNPQYMSYTTTKAALWAATKTAAQALAPHIRVNAIGPGPTLANSRQTELDFAKEAAAVPLGSGATPEEIAKAAGFILEASAMTGQMIALDGGQHLAWHTADIPKD